MTTTTTRIIRAAIYARVSTTGHGQDVGLQLDELRAVAEQRGWHVVGEFVDEGISGTATERPGLDAMLEAARRGKLDLVVVWKLDRLGRSLQHLLQLLDELQHLGVGFMSLRDAGMDTTSASGRLMFQLMGAFSEFEKALIQERVRAGVARAKAQGKHCGRPRRDIDLDLARLLRSQGHGVRRVARMMGVPKSTLMRHLALAQ